MPMSLKKKGSKRFSLRFSGGRQKLRFKTEFEDGEAIIDNISAGGCALSEISAPLVVNEKILLILELDGAENEKTEIGARVVRDDQQNIAVKFDDISNEAKSELVKFFAQMQRANMEE